MLPHLSGQFRNEKNAHESGILSSNWFIGWFVLKVLFLP
jgi:hypothetical protein